MRQSSRLKRYIALGLISEDWAVSEPEAAERGAVALAVLEADEGGFALPPGRGTWRGVAGLSVRETGEGGTQTVIMNTDGTQTVVPGVLS